MARVSQSYTPSMSFNKLKPDLLFQVLNGFCHRRLAENEFFRCASDMFVLSHCQKDTQILQVHNSILSSNDILLFLVIYTTRIIHRNNSRKVRELPAKREQPFKIDMLFYNQYYMYKK